MKKIIFTLALYTLAFSAIAQQDQQYTQFMFNKLGYNPAYAGSFISPSATAMYRSQWIGLEGSPSTQLISYHQPLLNERAGIGGNLVHTSIGINKTTTLDLAYAYQMPLWNGNLGIGIKASIRHLRQNWNDQRLIGSQPVSTDGAIPTEPKTKVVPNFGAGLYYYTPAYFVGFSVPRLVNNNIDFDDLGGKLSREVQHFYLMAGFNYTIAEGVVMTPQALVKYVKAAPLSADVNVNFEFQKRFLAGLTYRTGSGKVSAGGESMDLIAGIYATQSLYFGLSYDIGLTKIRKYNNGSVEATIRYWLNAPEGTKINDARNF